MMNKYKNLGAFKQKELKIEQINKSIKKLKKLRKLIKLEVIQPVHGKLIGSPIMGKDLSSLSA